MDMHEKLRAWRTPKPGSLKPKQRSTHLIFFNCIFDANFSKVTSWSRRKKHVSPSSSFSEWINTSKSFTCLSCMKNYEINDNILLH